ncbi:MAG: hypothetical protein EZS28_020559, partial [Streblomastix strix]
MAEPQASAPAETEENQTLGEQTETSTNVTVIITIFGVKGVVAVDSNGKSDPFIVVKFAGQEKKTKKVADTLDAEFNETFEFTFDPKTEAGRQLDLELWDYDSFSDNDILGKASLPFEQYANKKERCSVKFEGVEKHFGQDVGESDVEIEYKKNEPAPQPFPQKSESPKQVKKEVVKETKRKSVKETKSAAKSTAKETQVQTIETVSITIFGVKGVVAVDSNG